MKDIRTLTLSLLFFLIIGCNPYYKELKTVRNSPYLINEDKTIILEGIDKNNNGIRDDIESYINERYNGQEEYRNALLNLSKSLRKQFVIVTEDKEVYRELINEMSLHMLCINKIERKYGIEYSNRAFMEIVAIHTNTNQRMIHARKIDQILNGMTFSEPENKDCGIVK